MSQIEWYTHHGCHVAVQAHLKGKHREHCLCYQCACFNSTDREANCTLSNLIYALCVAEEMVLPVWECPHFIDEAFREGG